MVKHYAKLHFVVFLWGFTAILGVLISIPSVETVFYRTLISAGALGGLLLLSKSRSKIAWRKAMPMVLTGFIIALHWILFFASAKVSKISICLAGMATASLFTAVLEPLINRSQFKYYEVLLGFVVMGGLYAIFHFEYDHVVGLLLALGSAFLSAVFTVFNSGFSKKYDPISISFYEMLGACIGCVLMFPLYKVFFATGSTLQLIPSQTDWLWLAILAIVCTVYAFYACMQALQHVSAFTMNLIVNMEPVYGIVLAFLLFGETEQMSGGFYLGTSVILLAVLAYPIFDRRLKPKVLPAK